MDGVEYPKTWNILETNKLLDKWIADKLNNLFTFRDQTHTSVNSGVTSTEPKTPWFQNFEQTKESYIANSKEAE